MGFNTRKGKGVFKIVRLGRCNAKARKASALTGTRNKVQANKLQHHGCSIHQHGMTISNREMT
jgi:nucleoside 2-deoxyribosyltransferase